MAFQLSRFIISNRKWISRGASSEFLECKSANQSPHDNPSLGRSQDVGTRERCIRVTKLLLSFFLFVDCILKFLLDAIEETIAVSLRKLRKVFVRSAKSTLFLTNLHHGRWSVYSLSTSATFSLLDLDLAVNAYPVHFIRLCPPRVLQRYHVWNWLVQSNYRRDGRRRQDRFQPRPDRFYSALICYERRRRAESFYASWFQPAGKITV